MKIVIYGHGGSQNHGNEAIVRGVRELFPNEELLLYSFSKDEDERFDLQDICEIRNMCGWKTGGVRRFLLRAARPFLGKTSFYFHFLFYNFIKEVDKNAVYCLEAGDQYCEPGMHRKWYAYLNRALRRKDVKTVMLGCSIHAAVLDDKKVRKDIQSYRLVVARESLTYRSLQEKVKNLNAVLAPCPAFCMPMQKIAENFGGMKENSINRISRPVSILGLTQAF